MVTIGVVIGSVRPGRMGLRLAKFVQRELEQRPNVKVEVIDPLALNLPVLVNRYSAMKDKPDCPPSLHEAAKSFQKCDAFLLVSPEYNYTIPPAISNTLDYFYSDEFNLKPVGVASYSMGSFGGVRAATAMMPLFQCVGLVGIIKQFPVPTIQNALNEEGELLEKTSYPKMKENFKGFASELIWFAETLGEGKKNYPKA
ncbi:flavo protein [Rhizoclosmatium globosum]|uniref:Flavo protein n=1 Tax=Rhizoclosmatium globosum TaxID=329046 RepID=A0A1Y2C7Z6_9FUNG|nr:flavo protein [Rhizoclosmatium globosum]|eukprot:ORY43004.1 flavo protein [Rhizoclosmatium globosum]